MASEKVRGQPPDERVKAGERANMLYKAIALEG